MPRSVGEASEASTIMESTAEGGPAEETLAAVFARFAGSNDHGSAPGKSFEENPPVELVPTREEMEEGGVRLLYHQCVNALAFMGLFSSSEMMTAADQRVAMRLWPRFSPKQDGRCYFNDFIKVVRKLHAKRLQTVTTVTTTKPETHHRRISPVRPLKTKLFEKTLSPRAPSEVATNDERDLKLAQAEATMQELRSEVSFLQKELRTAKSSNHNEIKKLKESYRLEKVKTQALREKLEECSGSKTRVLMLEDEVEELKKCLDEEVERRVAEVKAMKTTVNMLQKKTEQTPPVSPARESSGREKEGEVGRTTPTPPCAPVWDRPGRPYLSMLSPTRGGARSHTNGTSVNGSQRAEYLDTHEVESFPSSHEPREPSVSPNDSEPGHDLLIPIPGGGSQLIRVDTSALQVMSQGSRGPVRVPLSAPALPHRKIVSPGRAGHAGREQHRRIPHYP